MFKCVNCGHIFEEGEQVVKSDRHGFRYGPAEEYIACPVCGGTDLDRTVRCRKCGGEYLEEEMHGHICNECVENYINYDSFFEFAVSGFEPDALSNLESFIFIELFGFGASDVPMTSSQKMKQYFQEIYKREVASEKLLGTHTFRDKINHYMSNWANRDYFAEWLEEKEATK